ncbi:MAG: proline--tRNA ligase, partial [Deltaproteobacteria bacterium]|nr:proline--tRNA ligase [Deltaproteobacteria bacterium]
DAYSFDADEEGANRSYEIMHEAYVRIFQRSGLRFRAVEADTGAIGGSFSHEFMVLADTGEDQIMHCLTCDYAANLERAEAHAPDGPNERGSGDMSPMEDVDTPDIKTVEEVTAFLGISSEELIKTLVFKVNDDEVVAAMVRGDHELNEAKLKSFLGAQSLEMAEGELVAEVTGAPVGFAGPVGLKVKGVADHAVKRMKNAVTGGNKKDVHLKNVNLGRDFEVDDFADLRMITPGDPCPRCGGEIRFGKGIEVGHIFKLGAKYSDALKAVFLDEEGRERPIIMGCYGIGVGRTVAAAIEQNHDKDGIIFPIPISPFEATILPLQIHDTAVLETAERIYQELLEQGMDVLLDDRDERAGVKFNDADLLGIPVRVTVGLKGLKNGQVEVKLRSEPESMAVPVQDAPALVMEKVKDLYDSIK